MLRVSRPLRLVQECPDWHCGASRLALAARTTQAGGLILMRCSRRDAMSATAEIDEWERGARITSVWQSVLAADIVSVGRSSDDTADGESKRQPRLPY